MKRLLMIMLTCFLGLTMSACSNLEGDASNDTKITEQQEIVNGETKKENNENILVVYFTYGENVGFPNDVDASSSASIQLWNNEVTGNTGIIAHMIADSIDADTFSIRTVEEYPNSYNKTVDQGRKENEANARPKLATHIENLDNYDTIFIGFPNWWYDMPMAIYSLLEEYDFSGKTIVPFSTSGGSGFSDTIATIEELEPNSIILEGLTIGESSVNDAQQDVNYWLKSLGYIK
ncbi:flavodoxin [Clostridium nigeriense]|uniref:flavodoxin n=1 Tax=Clostridium nigeriense TaxID=1805470 RepID=UPI003D3327D2